MKFSDPINQLLDNTNLQKYRQAGIIASSVLNNLIQKTKSGTLLYDLCTLGDKLILDMTSEVYKNINYKGIAFPTCISINNVAGFNCSNINDKTIIKDGDLVKIELGVHIDGYPALLASTVIIRDNDNIIDEKKSNVLKAAIEASKEIIKVMKIGNSSFDVMKILDKYAKKYECNLPYITEMNNCPGIMSYQMSRYIIDGYNEDDDEYIHHVILSKNNDYYVFKARDTPFEENEVYAIDILYCSGNGKLNRGDELNSLIFKRNINKRVQLKLKSSRQTLNVFGRNSFPINISTKLNQRFKLGLKECVEKGIIENYPVMELKKNEVCARIKFTVIIKDKPILIAGRKSDEELYKLSKFTK